MRYLQESSELIYKARLTDTVYSFTLKSPQIAALAQCGQFVQVLCEPYQLRRPISIGGFDAKSGVLRLIFEIRGKGTDWLSRCEEGDRLDLIGPLGHGFPLMDASQKAIMIGGGIGTPPLLPLAAHYGANATVIAGFKTASAVILQQDIEALGAKAVICTDDGSTGFAGFTTQALEQQLSAAKADVIYTCGPKIMMRKVATIAAAHGIACYVSMEQRMACGVGACLGCTCKTKNDDGETVMTRVCVNGPVFDAAEVDWT